MLAGPKEIGFNGGVEAAHLFLADLYGMDIKVYKMVDFDVLLDIENIALQFSATFLFAHTNASRTYKTVVCPTAGHMDPECNPAT